MGKTLTIYHCRVCKWVEDIMGGYVCRNPRAPCDDDEWAMDLGETCDGISPDCPLPDDVSNDEWPLENYEVEEKAVNPHVALGKIAGTHKPAWCWPRKEDVED